MSQAKQFRELHYSESPLVIANAWDVSSARFFDSMGFKAVATSSAALADTQGYSDGEEIPFGLLLEIVGRMKRQLSVPFSVDMERGFNSTTEGILANLEQLCKIGVSGVNIEDSGTAGPLQPVGAMTDLITAAKDFLRRKGLDMFLNIRTDAFLHKLPDALDETVKRVKAYEVAGADGVFAPFIYLESDIRAIAAACSMPLNVLSMKELPDFATLASWGVRRVSMGSSMYRSLQADLRRKTEAVKAEGSYRSIF